MSWTIAVVVVLILAVAAGLFTAYVVAGMRSVPGAVGLASPTPFAPNATAIPAASSSAPPPSSSPVARFTPTPAPTVQVTPTPFTYTVQPGDHLINIANMFGVNIQDLMALNSITNPNKISVGQTLLIPGYGTQPTPKPPKTPRG